MGELDGKVAVITGAGAGMARSSARVFVREGAKVLGADISGREEETAAELGDAFVPFHADVSNETDVEGMFAAAVGAFGRVDAVLNVAGIAGVQQSVADVDVDEFEKLMATNLRGVMLGTKHAIKTMLANGGGSILNWTSVAGLNAPRMPVSTYSAAKAGVIAITKAAAVEYGSEGIRANAICPGGVIVTEMSGGRAAVARHTNLVEAVPLKRAGEPEEVAELACFLASDRALFITGTVIPIDGGHSAVLAS
jgi:NAD(P)-dependent dehydrogenase (short-subunit alcohol dehydrogenase family)